MLTSCTCSPLSHVTSATSYCLGLRESLLRGFQGVCESHRRRFTHLRTSPSYGRNSGTDPVLACAQIAQTARYLSVQPYRPHWQMIDWLDRIAVSSSRAASGFEVWTDGRMTIQIASAARPCPRQLCQTGSEGRRRAAGAKGTRWLRPWTSTPAAFAPGTAKDTLLHGTRFPSDFRWRRRRTGAAIGAGYHDEEGSFCDKHGPRKSTHVLRPIL